MVAEVVLVLSLPRRQPIPTDSLFDEVERLDHGGWNGRRRTCNFLFRYDEAAMERLAEDALSLLGETPGQLATFALTSVSLARGHSFID